MIFNNTSRRSKKITPILALISSTDSPDVLWSLIVVYFRYYLKVVEFQFWFGSDNKEAKLQKFCRYIHKLLLHRKGSKHFHNNFWYIFIIEEPAVFVPSIFLLGNDEIKSWFGILSRDTLPCFCLVTEKQSQLLQGLLDLSQHING